jgi:hypothetical protein
MLNKISRQVHDNGNASLVISAKQRQAGSGDNIITNSFSQLRMMLRGNDNRRIIRQDNVASVIVIMQDW